jgi:hypothetical protein
MTRPQRSARCNTNWPPSSTPTTPSGPTARSTDKPPSPRSTRAPKPTPDSPASPSTATASAATKSTATGKITIRHKGRLHHIGLGRRHAGQTVAVLIAGRDIRVLNDTGELIRQLVLDPTRDYHAQNRT